MTTETSTPAIGRARQRPRRSYALLLIPLAILLLVVWGIGSRFVSSSRLAALSRDQAVPVVRVVKPMPAPATEELVLPGSVRGVMDTPIYARTSGYLARWLVDIGAPVKAGQLLAEIDTPEIDSQLRQAEADLNTAKANSALADVTANRWKSLVASDSVSRQEADEKLGDAAAKKAMLASAGANLARLKDLEGFKRVLAPFDGVVTARNVDVGALISAGPGGTGELFHMADPSRLRIYIDVPENDAAYIHDGQGVDLVFPQLPTRRFPASVVRNAQALDQQARSLRVEVELDNRDGLLKPGGYCEAHFKTERAQTTVRVPAGALIFDAAGLRIAVVGADDKANFRPVTTGRDFGTTVEVISGIGPDDRVIAPPPDALVEGETVRIAAPPPADKTN